jgi:hypothetical protein
MAGCMVFNKELIVVNRIKLSCSNLLILISFVSFLHKGSNVTSGAYSISLSSSI